MSDPNYPAGDAVVLDDSDPGGPLVSTEGWGDWGGDSPSTEIIYQPPEAVRAEVQHNWDEFRRKVVANHFDERSLLDGVERVYSTSRAAAFFGRSNQWMYWGLRNGIFVYKNGDPILPERIGKGGRRRFTLPLIREIALSCYRRGNISEEELQAIMAKILIAEFGRGAFADAE